MAAAAASASAADVNMEAMVVEAQLMARLNGKQAKAALKEAGIEFKDVEVTDAQKAELKALTGKTSVPQVFVKGQFIGGCNDGGLGGTVPLLKSGKLQEMLK